MGIADEHAITSGSATPGIKPSLCWLIKLSLVVNYTSHSPRNRTSRSYKKVNRANANSFTLNYQSLRGKNIYKRVKRVLLFLRFFETSLPNLQHCHNFEQGCHCLVFVAFV